MATIFVAQAQNKITGIKDDFPRGVPYYDKVNFEITYQVVEKNGTIRVNVSNPKVFVHPDSNYNVDGISYSKQDLGLSSWPQTQKPVRFGVSLNVQYPGGTVNHMFSCTESGICQDNDDYILRSVENTNKYKPADFQVSYNGEMYYDPQPDTDVNRRIAEKKNKVNSNSTAGSATNNSSITSETPTYSKQEITNQVVAGVAGLAGELINDWNVSRERKLLQKKEDDKLRESKEAVESHNKRLENFKVEYLRLMDKAIKGDEDARMTLYFASEYLIEPEKLLPQREQWFEQALTNNNKYALLEKAFEAWSKSITTKNEKDDLLKLELGYLERAAAVGSSTALFKLGRIYDWNVIFPKNRNI